MSGLRSGGAESPALCGKGYGKEISKRYKRYGKEVGRVSERKQKRENETEEKDETVRGKKRQK